MKSCYREWDQIGARLRRMKRLVAEKDRDDYCDDVSNGAQSELLRGIFAHRCRNDEGYGSDGAAVGHTLGEAEV